jgi:transcription elongation factor Elf1
MVACPRCDGQGSIQEVRIKQDGRILLSCDECEATWLSREAIGAEPWVDLSDYMESVGLTATSQDLEILKLR